MYILTVYHLLSIVEEVSVGDYELPLSKAEIIESGTCTCGLMHTSVFYTCVGRIEEICRFAIPGL